LAAADDRERAWQVRSPLPPPTPALGGGQHRELPRLGLWPVGIGHPQDAVGAQLVHAGHPQQPAAEGGLAHATPAPSGLTDRCSRPARAMPWSSCRHSTSGSPSRRARTIARAAETPADSVVRQGMLWVTAARRISQPSVRAPTPVGVFRTRSTSPRSIQSSTWGEPSPILLRRSTGTPIRAIAS